MLPLKPRHCCLRDLCSSSFPFLSHICTSSYGCTYHAESTLFACLSTCTIQLWTPMRAGTVSYPSFHRDHGIWYAGGAESSCLAATKWDLSLPGGRQWCYEPWGLQRMVTRKGTELSHHQPGGARCMALLPAGGKDSPACSNYALKGSFPGTWD